MFRRPCAVRPKPMSAFEHADDNGYACITETTWLTEKQLENKYKSKTQAIDHMLRAEARGLVRINPETGCKMVLYTNSTWKLLAPQRMRS